MTKTAELPRSPKGKRIHFFDDPAMDHMIEIITALTAEVSVLADRLAAVEDLLDQNGTMSRADLEAYQPDSTQGQQRQQARSELITRVFQAVEGLSKVSN